MNTEKRGELLLAIREMKIGDEFGFICGPGLEPSGLRIARAYARTINIKVETSVDESFGKIIIKRIDDVMETPFNFRNLARVGDELVLSNVPASRMNYLRSQASRWATSMGYGARVWQHTDGTWRVTIVDTSVESATIFARIQTESLRAKKTGYDIPLKWGLGTMGINETHWVPLSEQHLIGNIRSYTVYHGVRLGRKFTVRAEGGIGEHGGHRVTRIA